jgi:hypothetical protein
MNAIEPSHQTIFRDEQKSLTPILCKSLVVVATVIGLAAAVFFSGHALMALISAGAAWQIGLVTVGCLLSSAALLGAGFFATQHRMFEDTEENLKDSAQFFLKTLATPYYAARAGLQSLQQSR